MIDVDLFNCNHKNCTRVSHYFRTHTNSTSENMRTATLYNIALPVVWFPSIVFVLRRRRPQIELYCDINMFTAAGGEKKTIFDVQICLKARRRRRKIWYIGVRWSKNPGYFPPTSEGRGGVIFCSPPLQRGVGGKLKKCAPPPVGGGKKEPCHDATRLAPIHHFKCRCLRITFRIVPE